LCGERERNGDIHDRRSGRQAYASSGDADAAAVREEQEFTFSEVDDEAVLANWSSRVVLRPP
jgi:hypothetical protein